MRIFKKPLSILDRIFAFLSGCVMLVVGAVTVRIINDYITDPANPAAGLAEMGIMSSATLWVIGLCFLYFAIHLWIRAFRSNTKPIEVKEDECSKSL